MSGPKSYSVTVFDKQLKILFLLESEISVLWEALQSKKLCDSKREIEVNCGIFLEKNKKTLERLSNPFRLNENEPLNQQQFNRFYNLIHNTLDQMQLFKNKLNEELLNYEKIESAYNEYLNLEKQHVQLQEDFQTLKSEFIEYIKQNMSYFANAESLISEVNMTELVIRMPVFNQSFVETATDWKIAFDQKFEDSKKQLNKIVRNAGGMPGSTQVNTKVSVISIGQPPKKGIESQVNADVVILKIRNAIDSLNKSQHADFFRQRFAELLKTHDKKHVYYFTEFLEELIQSQKQAGYRETLNNMTVALNSTGFYAELTGQVEYFRKKLSNALQRDRINISDVENLKRSYEELLVDQNKLKQQKIAELQERNFIRARLVSELQELDYEVMTDMNVIDFENNNSFLFLSPDQENYINLRFDKQGHLLYNFLIPENRETLTHEKTQIRLAEMQQTCDEFKKLLANLKSQGLNIHLENEIVASQKNLIQLPSRFAKFTTKPKRKVASKSPAIKKKPLQ